MAKIPVLGKLTHMWELQFKKYSTNGGHCIWLQPHRTLYYMGEIDLIKFFYVEKKLSSWILHITLWSQTKNVKYVNYKPIQFVKLQNSVY